jgi:hypothetical protein
MDLHVCPECTAFCVAQVKLVVTCQSPGERLYGNCIPVRLTTENSPFYAPSAKKVPAHHIGLEKDEIPEGLLVSILAATPRPFCVLIRL